MSNFDSEHDIVVAAQKRVSAELDAMIQLHRLSTLCVTESDLGIILSEIVDAAIAVTGADFGNIQLIDPVSSALRIVAQRGFPQWWIDFWNNVPEGQGSCGLSFQRGERVIVEDVEQSPIFAGPALEMQLKASVRAVQSTPLISRSGRPLGMFSTHYKKPQRPNEDKLRYLDLLARQAADIIEHVQTIAMLRDSEERFRSMADGIPLMIWVSYTDGSARFINKAYAEFHGITLEQLKVRGWQSLIHRDDLAAYAAEVTARLQDRRSLHAKVRVKRRDGEWRWVECFAQPLVSSSGEFLGLAGSGADITESKRAEEALREGEERSRLAQRAAHVGIWDWHLGSGRLDWTPELERIYGYEPGTFPGNYIAFRDRVHPGDLAEAERIRDEAVKTRQPFDCDFRLRLPSGETRWVNSKGSALYDEAGLPQRVFGVNVDITERKRAEEAARQQASLLRVSFDAIIVWRFDLGIESWNQGAETLYGFTEREAIGHSPPDLLKTVFPISLSETKAVLQSQGNWEGELRHQTKDGREVIVSARFQLIIGDDGTLRVLEINRDITERKHMEEERAEEERRKDEFLSLLGHELRNPLATISTAAQLLSGSVTDEERVSLNGMMRRQVNLMQRLLDDLLDLARITHGYIQLKKEGIDLANFVQHAIEVTQATIAERRQNLILHLPSEVVTFNGDEARLEQVVINLLNNASKYTSDGGRIELSGAREGSEVVFRCKDNGRGIPREMQAKIFEPFTRVEPFSDSRGEASLGIGLALVKRLVELHGGTISVESGGPGMGSEFSVRLPLEPAPSNQPVVPKARPISRSRRSRSIIVVEDNADAAGTMAIALERAGYRVTLFADASSALAGLSDLEPHAVLIDIALPGMDGYELAAKLRGNRHLQHTLFIGISGFKRRVAEESGGGFDHYFNKPVDLPALFTLLDTAQPEQLRPHRRGILEEVRALRVLLIDDHAELAAAQAELLRSKGLEVRTALSGQEGLEAADFKPQLILCDLNLPDMSGQEVIRVLRSNPLTRNSYTVVLTAMSNEDIREFNREAKGMGIDEFIPKPLTSEVIRTLVTKVKQQQSR